MADYKLIIKYIKVRALAQKGSPGERDNAARMLSKLETTHPTLKSQVASFERKRNQPRDDLPPGVTPKHSQTVWNPTNWNSGNWENIFQYAQSAMSTAYGVAEAYARAQKGAALGAHVGLKTQLSKKGDILITFKIEPSIYREMLDLDESQKAMLKRELQISLANELTRLLG